MMPKEISWLTYKTPMEKVYAEFEDYETGPESGEASTECSDTAVATAVATKINDFIQPKTSDQAKGLDGDSFKSLADEFSVLEKTSPAIDANLAETVKSAFRIAHKRKVGRGTEQVP